MFPVFGAASGAIAVLPLAFIITVTAIKDAVEDYRRSILDEQVNTSSATKLGSWRNVNQPTDPRNWLERLLGINKPGRVTKGVKKLRDREAGKAWSDMKALTRGGEADRASISTHGEAAGDSSLDLGVGAGGRRLEDIQSVDSHSYPPGVSMASFSETSTQVNKGGSGSTTEFGPGGFSSTSKYQQSLHSHTVFGVVDWRKRAGGSARWERTLWKKLEVGDIVLLRDNDQVPADIVVLSTSDPDGMCYLETKNLDGETNLKPRRSCKATSTILSEEDIERSAFYLDSEPPHQNLYLYHGVLRYKDPSTDERRQEPVSINELLLRGCSLRNTSWVIGLVVFTGADTKIMLNGGDTPSKRSKIERETNFNVAINFILLVLMCVIGAVFNGLQDADNGTSSDFFEVGADPTNSYVLNGLVTAM